MTTQLNFVEDDNNHVVEITLKADGVAVDLTGTTVALILKIDGTAQSVTGTVDADQVTNKGVVSFTLTSTHLATAGAGMYEVQVTAGSDVLTYPTTDPGKVRIRSDLS